MPLFSATSGQHLPPEQGAVQVWRLSTAESVIDGLGGLTPDERRRAERMRIGTARDEFVLGRTALRVLLGSLLKRGPLAVELKVGEHGRPGVLGLHDFNFNVAHCRGLILIALCRGGRVGIDVEYRNPAVEVDDIAASSFHADERADIRAAGSGVLCLNTFYRCWTRKEAVLKADGRGLLDDLSIFSVAPCMVHRDSPGAELDVRLPGAEPLWVRDLEPAAGFAGALACDHPGFRVDFIDGRWEGDALSRS